MEHPPAILEKAQRLEQLLLRVAAGEPLEEVNAELGFDLTVLMLAHQQAKYESGGRTWEALIDGRHGHPRKAHSALREWLYARKEADDSLRAPQLVKEIQEKFGVTLTDGHVNHLLRKRALTAPPGRPFKQSPDVKSHTEGQRPPNEENRDEASTIADVSATADVCSESVDNAGLFFPGGGKGRDGGSSSS
jgi:transposase